jgi:hypothetical protein
MGARIHLTNYAPPERLRYQCRKLSGLGWGDDTEQCHHDGLS